MIDLQLHWWGVWIAPCITLALAALLAKVTGVVILQGGVGKRRVSGESIERLSERAAVRCMFNWSFLFLTTLLVLSSTMLTRSLSNLLFKLYCTGAVLLFVIALREGFLRGKRWLENTFLLALRLG